eukprot:1130960-Prymnesium_polylepis.1
MSATMGDQTRSCWHQWRQSSRLCALLSSLMAGSNVAFFSYVHLCPTCHSGGAPDSRGNGSMTLNELC